MIKLSRGTSKRLMFLYALILGGIIFLLGVFVGIVGKCNITELSLNNDGKIIEIFTHNLVVGIQIFCLGALSGGIYGIAVLLINGFIVGELIQYLVLTNSTKLIITGIMPHIFCEAGALVCFSVLGAVPIYYLVLWLKKKELNNIGSEIKKFFLITAISTALLFVAAFVECNISSTGIM